MIPDYFSLYGTEDSTETWVTSDSPYVGKERWPTVQHDVDQAVTHWAGHNWGEATWCGYRNNHGEKFSQRPEEPTGWFWRMPPGAKNGPVYYVGLEKRSYDKIYLFTGFTSTYQTACEGN
ncbi:hypothetical protein A5768_23555 [Mycolicibacterium fortuitum]|nr:hypothetical protein A5768_23555 [Mycolicibacterium fortuitum]